MQADMGDSSEDDVEDLESVSVEIPECEGLPRRLWNTKCVTLYNKEGKLVGEGMCHSMKSDLVVGANGPLVIVTLQFTSINLIPKRTSPKICVCSSGMAYEASPLPWCEPTQSRSQG